MNQQIINIPQILQDKKFPMQKISNNTLQNPIFNEENNHSKEAESFLLTEFLDINNFSLSKEITKQMLKIFNPSKSEPEDILEEEESNKIFFLSNKKQNQSKEFSPTDDKSSENLSNQKNNNIISEKLFHIQESNHTKKHINGEKIQFISKKRKNSENNTNEYDDSTKKEISSINKNKDIKGKETNENEIKILKNERQSKYQYRLDYYKKSFKVNCFKYLTKFLNNLITQCNFPNEFKNRKIFKPNNESFTANAKEEDNYKFLYMSIKDIYCFLKEGKKNEGISLQLRNKKFIDDIIQYIEAKGKNISKEFDNLKKYLNMSMEEYIKIYYNTNEFKKFCKEEKIKYYEEEFIKEKKFPMLKDYGFLKLIKMYSFNKNFSNGLKSIHSIMNGINSV